MSDGHQDENPQPVIVVDAANVVGSKPDGWWRDRRGATERLRDELAPLAENAVVILVVEGRARGVASTPDIEVVDAPGSGDDQIVELVAAQTNRLHTDVTVVTADRELRERVRRLGARVLGPASIRG